uniref:Uncharacterized protein n=3 Tax=unclassified Caudoviricetes TaxID=2788787 RepID=A0A8S5QZ31_9CAUD|nr:MAG TPA: hypothetical protein [Siphoviridae sp. ctOSJ35]DAE16000.1 MAG TPA: hypothetical protein [Siphoviridae sp. ctIOF8]DAE24527.1 MAG TPA: hypothetical protein [Siphoviridae sp. ctyvQ1]DAK06607.1 MAG TPA: hypothetical protein [Caudoviricetes sp.]DAM81054.1 MAG TPA: hypothetical protein [Caudoviricetes sp.]
MTQQTVALSYIFKLGWSNSSLVIYTLKPLYHCRVEVGKAMW